MNEVQKDAEQMLNELREILETTETPGWKLLTQQWSEEVKVLEDIRNVKDEKSLIHQRSALMVLDRLVNLQTICEEAVKQIEDLKKAAKTDLFDTYEGEEV